MNTEDSNDSSELRELFFRLPYMFLLQGNERARSYIFFRGWISSFAKLCVDIDQILEAGRREFQWVRIREKFGAPSFAYVMQGRARHVVHAHRPNEVRRISCAPAEAFDPASIAIQEAVLQTEVVLRERCIVCGRASAIVNNLGPWASLCSTHRSPSFMQSLDHSGLSIWSRARLTE